MSVLSFLDLSSYAGLAATGLFTLNILLGTLLGIAYKKHRYWVKLPQSIKQINIYKLHNCTAYIALLLMLIHPIFLLFDPKTTFKFIDIVFPLNAPHQKLFVALGTLSMFAIFTLVITSQKVVKNRMSFRTWKNIHLISYFVAPLFILHGIVMDPQLLDRPLDLLDAEKILSELCLVILVAAGIFRYRYHLTNQQSKTKKSL